MSIKKGDTVFVHYTGTFDDGTEFDSSRNRAPLEFVMGAGMVIPGFEAAVAGKKAGDALSVRIPPAEAYGEHEDRLVFLMPRDGVPKNIELEKGLWLQLAMEQGDLDVVVSRVTDKEVELDGNHPLAGKTLHFDMEIVDVKRA